GGSRIPGGGLLRAQRSGDRDGDAGQRRARLRVQGGRPRPSGRGRAGGCHRPAVRDPVAGQGDARRPAPGPAGAVGAGAAERQALLLWFQGMSKASVGRRMSISENTVRQYISRARAKYAATGRTAPSKDALLARAIEDGVIKPGEIMPYQSFARAAADRPSL